MSGELLLEIRAEEIPARMLPGAIRELSTRLFEELMPRGLAPAEIETGFTPRRLLLVFKGLPEKEKDRVEESYGPPLSAAWKQGAWSPAAQGFAKKVGVADLEALELFQGKPGKEIRARAGVSDAAARAAEPDWYLGHRREVAGRPTRDVLSELLPKLIAAIGWAKTMKWGTAEGPWVRPVHGVVAILDGEVVPFQLFDVSAGERTAGHPVLSPESFDVAGAEDYRRKLASRHIEVSFDTRRMKIWDWVQQAAHDFGGEAVVDEALLDKLAAICEIPGVSAGRLSEDVLALPREVLQTSLRDHQSAFTGEKDGRLLPAFFTVMDRADDPKGRVRAGNEWVVAARLADAKFFYAEDRKTPLAARAEKLSKVTFHEKLGSYADKSQRVEKVALELAGFGEHAKDEKDRVEGWVRQTVPLLKLDLTCEMVREFTSLQGVMGGIYAREDGEPEAVSQAIYDQYLPASPSDSLPRGEVGAIVGIADRLDTLVGLFGLGMVPTGSKDPFGLRRAALGLVRIALDRRMPFTLDSLAGSAFDTFGEKLKRERRSEVANLVVEFAFDRLRYQLELEGLAHDEIRAGIGDRAVDGQIKHLFEYRDRVLAFSQVRRETWFTAVAQAAKRIQNITREVTGEHRLSDQSANHPAEVELLAAARTVSARPAEDYVAKLSALQALAAPLERYFTDVLVMDPDMAVRTQRLSLLKAIDQQVFQPVGKLTEIVA